PDVNPGDKTAEEKFKAPSEANDVLSDPKKRKIYDQLGFYSDNIDPAAAEAYARGGQPVPVDLAVFPAASLAPAVRERTSISEGSISPICSKELGAGELVEAREVSATSSPEFSADAAAPPRRKAPSWAQISNTR